MSKWSAENSLDRKWIVLLGGLLLVSILAVIPRTSRSSSGQIDASDQTSLRVAIENAPSDREVLSQIAEQAFETDAGQEPRWRLAALTLRKVAPGWLPGKVRVLRSGLFHWPELSAEGRTILREEAEVLLRQPEYFRELSTPLYRLTGDMKFILLNSPLDAAEYNRLVKLSLSGGKFDDYRMLRQGAPFHFEKILEQLERLESGGDEIVRNLLAMPLSDEMVPVARSYLNVLKARSPSGGRLDSEALGRFVEWAKREQVGPLAPLYVAASQDPEMPPAILARVALAAGQQRDARLIYARAGATRSADWYQFQLDLAESSLREADLSSARAALAVLSYSELETLRALSIRERVATRAAENALATGLANDRLTRFGPHTASNRWAGLCERQLICNRSTALELSTSDPVAVSVTLVPEIRSGPAAWVELRDNDEVIAESRLGGETSLVATVPAGNHNLVIEVMNPMTGTGERRRITLQASSFRLLPASLPSPQRPRQ